MKNKVNLEECRLEECRECGEIYVHSDYAVSVSRLTGYQLTYVYDREGLCEKCFNKMVKRKVKELIKNKDEFVVRHHEDGFNVFRDSVFRDSFK